MKKLLALVLALVMTMSLAVVSTSAASVKYSDAGDVKEGKYQEAIDVMSEIGVLAGDVNGDQKTFRPNDTLKRSEGAKIISYLLLGNSAAEQMKGNNKFVDVPASEWYAGYVEYLAVEGIVGGVGDNRFDPDGPLTTAAFTKMLLGALGYDAEIEGLGGPDWMINVQKLAKQVKLFDGNDTAVATSNITRQEAALYAYNTIKSPLVEYENKGSTLTVNGATINFGAGKAQYRVNTGKNLRRYDQIDDKTTNNGLVSSQIVEFAEEYYDKLVLKGNGDEDAFGRPADKWTYDGRKIGTYTNTADKVYTTTVTLGEIYKDLKLNVDTYPTDDKTLLGDSIFFWNGLAQPVVGVQLTNNSNVKIGGNGTETSVYYDEGKVRICMVDWFVGDVTGVHAKTSSKEAYIDISGRGSTLPSGTKETTDYKVDDVVLYTATVNAAGNWSIEDVTPAETVKGKLDSFVMKGVEGYNAAATGSVTLAGKKYTYSAQVANTPDGTFVKNGVELEIVLDKYGYAIDVGDYGVQNYAVVVKRGIAGTFGNDPVVELLLTDGTTTGAVYLNTDDHKVGAVTAPSTMNVALRYVGENVTLPFDIIRYNNTADDTYFFSVDSNGTATPENGAAGNEAGIQVGDIVTYTVGSNGKYTLNLKKHVTIYTNDSARTQNLFSNSSSALLGTAFNATAEDDQRDAVANGKTVFLIKDAAGNYKAYEGIKNVPNVTLNAMGAIGPNNGIRVSSYASIAAAGAAGPRTTGDTKTSAAAQVVYVDPVGNGVIRSNDAIFVHISNQDGMNVSPAHNNYYGVEAVVNGKHYEAKAGDESTFFKISSTSYADAVAQLAAIGRTEGYVLYESMTVSNEGIATLAMPSVSDAGFAFPTIGSRNVQTKVVGLGQRNTVNNQPVSFFSYTNDVSVWEINQNGDLQKVTINAVPDSTKKNRPVYVWYTKDGTGTDVNYIFFTEFYSTIGGGNAVFDYKTDGMPTYAELQSALIKNNVVDIENTGLDDVILPLGLVIPEGHKLNIWKGTIAQNVYGDVWIANNGALTSLELEASPSATRLTQLNARNITIDGRVLIDTAAELNAAGTFNITANGHVKSNGVLAAPVAGVTHTIAGNSLEMIGGSAIFGGLLKIVGNLTIKVGVLRAASLTVAGSGKVALSDSAALSAAEIKMEEGAELTVGDASVVADTKFEVEGGTTITLTSATSYIDPGTSGQLKYVAGASANAAAPKITSTVTTGATIKGGVGSDVTDADGNTVSPTTSGTIENVVGNNIIRVELPARDNCAQPKVSLLESVEENITRYIETTSDMGKMATYEMVGDVNPVKVDITPIKVSYQQSAANKLANEAYVRAGDTITVQLTIKPATGTKDGTSLVVDTNDSASESAKTDKWVLQGSDEVEVDRYMRTYVMRITEAQ